MTVFAQTQGYDQLIAKAKQFFEELEPYYHVLVDAFEWKEATLLVLNEIGNATVDMKVGALAVCCCF